MALFGETAVTYSKDVMQLRGLAIKPSIKLGERVWS
jgi:hypothetical protein